MDLQEIKAYFETNKDNEEVKGYLAELGKVTVDGADAFIDSEDGKKWLGKKNDSFFTRSLETWKSNNLDGLVEKAYKEKHPDADPKDIELQKMKTEIEKMKAETIRKELTNSTIKTLTEKKLPLDVVDLLVGNDEESTTKNVDLLEKVFTTNIEAMVKERLSSGYKPPSNADGDKKDVDGLSPRQMMSDAYAKTK